MTRSRITLSSAMRLHLRRLEQLRVEAGICRRARSTRSRSAASNSACVIGWPATLATDLLVAAGEAAVALDAEEDERRKDEQHEHELQRARVTAEEIEHRSAQMARKANRSSPFVEEAGILAERCAAAAARARVVGAEGLEPPTYAL